MALLPIKTTCKERVFMLDVLVVDDASFMRTVIKGHLTDLGYNVCGEAEDGAKAVKLYQELKPDCVTMDITMPNMDGIEAVSQIMKFDPSARIIMCSAMGQKDMVVEAIQKGAKDFVVKPLTKDRLAEALGKIK